MPHPPEDQATAEVIRAENDKKTRVARRLGHNRQIDGRTYRVAGSHYLMLPAGLQYTIEYPCRFRSSDGPMNDERALEIVFPLMKHAYQRGLHRRRTVTKVGRGPVAPSRIGVVLFTRQGQRVQGYRVALTLGEIKRRIAQGSASTRKVNSRP